MNRFSNSIRESLNTENWHAALMMALTMPDICGLIETPEENSKTRSVNWLKRWIEPLYTHRIGHDAHVHVFFHAEDCYALRCSFIHEGSSMIEQQRARKVLDDFHFIVPPSRGGIKHCNQKNSYLQLQVDIFCNQIADKVDEWAESIAGNPEIEARMAGLILIHDS